MNQEVLREKAKMLKWKYDIDYKRVAEDVLVMSYNAYLNFINGYKDLGYARAIKLEKYITDLEQSRTNHK